MGLKPRPKRPELVFAAPLVQRYMGTNARGRLHYSVVYVPEEVIERAGLGPRERARMTGTIEDQPVALALTPDRDRGHYLMVSKGLQRKLRCHSGDMLRVVCRLVDPNQVEVPAELEAALGKDTPARHLWRELTPGRQRTWTTYVDRAKQAATREKRCREVVQRVLDGRTDPRS